MVVFVHFRIHRGYGRRAVTALGKRRGVGCAREYRAEFQIHTVARGAFFVYFARCLVVFHRSVQIAVVYAQIFQLAQSFIGDEHRFHVFFARIVGVLFYKRGRSAQTRFFRTGDERHHFRVFQAYAVILQSLYRGYRHVAGGEVVVCAGHYFARVGKQPEGEEEGHEYDARNAYPKAVARNHSERTAQHARRQGDCEHINDAQNHQNYGRQEHLVTADIVPVPLVNGVGVSVDYYAASDFAGRGIRTHYVARFPFVEKRVEEGRVQHELEYHGYEREQYAHEYHNRRQEVDGHRQGHEHRHKVRPAEKGVRRNLEFVAVHFVAHFTQLVRHVVKGFVFALAARVAVAEVYDDVLNLVAYVGNAFFAFFRRNFRYFHSTSSEIN